MAYVLGPARLEIPKVNVYLHEFELNGGKNRHVRWTEEQLLAGAVRAKAEDDENRESDSVEHSHEDEMRTAQVFLGRAVSTVT